MFVTTQGLGSPPYIYIAKVVMAPSNIKYKQSEGLILNNFKLDYYTTKTNTPRISGPLIPVQLKQKLGAKRKTEKLQPFTAPARSTT